METLMAIRSEHLNSNLKKGIAQRQIQGDLHLLQTLPTVSKISIFPDASREPLGIGVPVGVSFLTSFPEPLILPTGITDANDGYRLVRLHIKEEEIASKLPELLEALLLLRSPWRNIENQDIQTLCWEGLEALPKLGFPITQLNQARTWQKGKCLVNRPADLLFSEETLELLKLNFGRFGGYGHFLEIGVIDELFAPAWQLEPGEVVMIIHGGAMEFSNRAFWEYYFEFAENADTIELIPENHYLAGLFGLPSTHPLSQKFLEMCDSATNVAYAWRAVVQERVSSLLGDILNRALSFELLSDLPHTRLEKTPEGFLHAKGVQPLIPPGHPDAGDYFETGIPTIICGEIGLPSFLITGGPEAAKTDFSSNHGHGKSTIFRAGPDIPENLRKIAQTLHTNRPERLVSGSKLKQQWHNLEDALFSLTEIGASTPKARIRPLINFSGTIKAPLKMTKSGKDLLLG